MALRNPNPQDATLSIRLYREELKIIQKAAKIVGKSMAEAVRETMLTWSKRIAKRAT